MFIFSILSKKNLIQIYYQSFQSSFDITQKSDYRNIYIHEFLNLQ